MFQHYIIDPRLDIFPQRKSTLGMFPFTSVDLFPRTDGVEKGAFNSYKCNSKHVETVSLIARK